MLRQWNELALQMERPEVFYTCEWAHAVQAAYCSSLKPLLFLGYEGSELAGVASLATDSDGKRVSFLAATTGDYCEFLSDLQRRDEFVDAVFAALSQMEMNDLVLANFPADSATPGALRAAAKKHGFHIYIRPAYQCAQIDLGMGEAREELKRTLQNKKKLRRHLRELEKEGPVEFSHLKKWDDIREILPSFADAHVARFAATQRVSSLATPERRRFLEALSQRLAGAVTLSMMAVGGRPVAWNYGFQFGEAGFGTSPRSTAATKRILRATACFPES